MLSYNAMGTYVLVVTLATVFVIILVARQQRAKKDIAIWLISGLVGIVLGAAAAAGIVQAMGYEITKRFIMPPEDELGEDGEGGGEEGGEGGESGGGMGMGSGGPGGMGMMGMGGGRGPSPKRQLTMLVRKVDLLTGDVALNLSDEQGTALTEILGKIKSQEEMTDEEASTLNDEILALLEEDQKAKQDAIGLPFRRSGRGGSPGGPSGSPGGGEQAENANPFAQEQNAGALDALLQRFGKEVQSAPAPDTEPEEATTDQPETPKE